MYRVTYEQGNGYRCSCCRTTYTETEDFDDKEDMIGYLVNMTQNGDDWELEEIREIKDEDLTNKYSEIVDGIITNSKKSKARKIKLEQIKNKLTKNEEY